MLTDHGTPLQHMYALPPLSHAFLAVASLRVWFSLLQAFMGLPVFRLAFQPQAGLQQSQ
ncbi:MAG: hypothetical protein QM756_24580 [Polyangiaceae bacterium]